MAEVDSSVRAGDCSEAGAGGGAGAVLSAAERARCERNRLRARALRDARLADRPPALATHPALPAGAAPPKRGPVDSGGGFLLEPEEAPAACPRASAPAPLQPHEQPPCRECGRPIPTSYLLDTFGYEVCDDCRDEEGAHSLLTRTEAKTEFLLKDCDLDGREPPLPCVRRPNPHRGARHDMRLYLRAQVERRALAVWGSERALAEQRAARDQARARLAAARERRRLRALRMDVRSSLYSKHHERERAAHRHRWAPEAHDADADTYSRACLDCGHTETYEKM